MTVAASTEYWIWRGHRVYYRQAGTSGSAILLVHGFGASTDHWRYNIPVLAEHHRVWAVDLLGFGRSAKPDLAYDGDLWRDQLRDFCQEIIQAPVIAVGNSLGGYSALAFAADHPELSRGLVLINGAGPFDDAPKDEGFRAVISKAIQGFFQQPWASNLLFDYMRNPQQIRKTLLQVYKDPRNVNDELVEQIHRASLDPGAAQVFARVFSSPQGRSLNTLLGQLELPLLLLWGALDPWMSVDRAQRFRQIYPAATWIPLQAGHCPHDECPEPVNAALLKWIADLD